MAISKLPLFPYLRSFQTLHLQKSNHTPQKPNHDIITQNKYHRDHHSVMYTFIKKQPIWPPQRSNNRSILASTTSCCGLKVACASYPQIQLYRLVKKFLFSLWPIKISPYLSYSRLQTPSSYQQYQPSLLLQYALDWASENPAVFTLLPQTQPYSLVCVCRSQFAHRVHNTNALTGMSIAPSANNGTNTSPCSYYRKAGLHPAPKSKALAFIFVARMTLFLPRQRVAQRHEYLHWKNKRYNGRVPASQRTVVSLPYCSNPNTLHFMLAENPFFCGLSSILNSTEIHSSNCSGGHSHCLALPKWR